MHWQPGLNNGKKDNFMIQESLFGAPPFEEKQPAHICCLWSIMSLNTRANGQVEADCNSIADSIQITHMSQALPKPPPRIADSLRYHDF